MQERGPAPRGKATGAGVCHTNGIRPRRSLVGNLEDLVADGGLDEVEGALERTVAGGQTASPESIGHGGDLQPGGHFTVSGGTGTEGSTGTRSPDGHTEPELLVPVDGTGESRDTAEIDGQVAIADGDAGTATDQVIFGPQTGTTTTGVVEVELDVVGPIGGNGTGGVFQAGLEVDGGIGGGGGGGGMEETGPYAETQGNEEQTETEADAVGLSLPRTSTKYP